MVCLLEVVPVDAATQLLNRATMCIQGSFQAQEVT